MKLSSSHGILVLSESSFRLLTYKHVKQLNSILFSDSLEKDPHQATVINDETRQQYFLDSVAALEKSWPDRYRLEGRRVKKWSVLIPAHWLVHIRDHLPKIGSNYLLSLASLSLVSEKIRLAPDKLCYGYKAVDGEGDFFDIFGCAMEWITRIKDICSQVEIVSVHPYDVKTVYSEALFNTLLEIEAYRPLKWQQRKQLQLAKLFISVSVVLALLGLVILLWLSRQQEASIQFVEEAKSQYQTLAPAPIPLLKFAALQAALLAIPLQIKVVTFEFDKQRILLNVYGTHEQLNALLTQWQSQWPDVVWRIRDFKGPSTFSQRLKYTNNQAQEVLYAVIMGKKTSL